MLNLASVTVIARRPSFGVIAILALAVWAEPGPATIALPDHDGAGGVEWQGKPIPIDRGGDSPIDVSRLRFERMSDFEIRELNDARLDGRRIRLTGFSTVMSGWLIFMADADRRRTQRLVREMREIDDPEAREEHLRDALDDARDFEENLVNSIERLRERERWVAVAEEQRRLRNLRDFIEGLEVWVDYPHEGTR